MHKSIDHLLECRKDEKCVKLAGQDSPKIEEMHGESFHEKRETEKNDFPEQADRRTFVVSPSVVAANDKAKLFRDLLGLKRCKSRKITNVNHSFG